MRVLASVFLLLASIELLEEGSDLLVIGSSTGAASRSEAHAAAANEKEQGDDKYHEWTAGDILHHVAAVNTLEGRNGVLVKGASVDFCFNRP